MPVTAVVGYDGSPAANAAIEVGATLFPGARAQITYLWVPPFASETVRRRLKSVAKNVTDLIDLVEQEGQREAQRLVSIGVTLARSAGWDAAPELKQTWGAEGLRLAEAAEQASADVVIVGSRGLGGAKAALGSVSDMVVNHAAVPVVVIPYPLLSTEYAALPEGPVVVGWDGSEGAAQALAAARYLLPSRTVLAVTVGEEVSEAPPPDVTHVFVEKPRGFHASSIAEPLVAAAALHGAATVAVGTRGQSKAKDLLLGSVAVGTLHQAHRPVLVVPPGWRA
ncbi:universal stress protein [Mycolicibacterium phlei]